MSSCVRHTRHYVQPFQHIEVTSCFNGPCPPCSALSIRVGRSNKLPNPVIFANTFYCSGPGDLSAVDVEAFFFSFFFFFFFFIFWGVPTTTTKTTIFARAKERGGLQREVGYRC